MALDLINGLIILNTKMGGKDVGSAILWRSLRGIFG